MNNQPILYDSLKSILHHMDANMRINMPQRMPSIRATEKVVPLKMRYLSISDTTVKINNVHYKLGVCRNYPNGAMPQYVKTENDYGGVENDFDRFGFEIPIGSNPILPGDVSVRNGDERVMRTDIYEFEEHYQNELNRCEILLRGIAEMELGVEPNMNDSWRSPENRGYCKKDLQEKADHARVKLKPFHCRRHNLPRPFNCYIQLSIVEDEKAKRLQRLAYTRKLYEAVKQFNHILFANRPVIQVKKLLVSGNQVYRIPLGLKISANQLAVEQSQIVSIAKILEGDVNTIRVLDLENANNWWQHRIVQNASELIIEGPPSIERFALILRTLGNEIIRFHTFMYLSIEQYCELIENWMSVKREVGSELWIGLDYKKPRKKVLEMIQARLEVVRRDERCVTVHDKNGKQIELCEELCKDESLDDYWAVKVKIIKN